MRSFTYTSAKMDKDTNKQIVIDDASYYQCRKCGHDWMTELQSNHLTAMVNERIKK